MSQKEAHQAAEESQSGSPRGSCAVAPVPVSPAKRPEKLPPFRVLLHNDEVNTFEHVVKSILKLTTLTPHEALLRTIEAHETGIALLLVTHRERAELFTEQFATFKITTTIEPEAG